MPASLVNFNKAFSAGIVLKENPVTSKRGMGLSTPLRVKLKAFRLYGKVVILDCGMTDKEKESLMGIAKEYSGIYCVLYDDIKEFFDGRI